MISPNVIRLGRAVLGYDNLSVDEIKNIIWNATIAELVATKLLLERYHPEEKTGLWIINFEISEKELERRIAS